MGIFVNVCHVQFIIKTCLPKGTDIYTSTQLNTSSVGRAPYSAGCKSPKDQSPWCRPTGTHNKISLPHPTQCCLIFFLFHLHH